MKLNQLYSDIDNNVINTTYNKLKKFKLKNNIKTRINDYKISFNKVNIELPINTRYTLLKNNFDLSNYTPKQFSIYWDQNFDKLNKWYNYLSKYNNFSSKINGLIYSKLILSKFISQFMINDIIKNCKYYCTIIGNNRNIIIFGKTKKEIKDYIFKTLHALDYFNLFYIDNTKLNLFIFLSDVKKKFPNDNFYTPFHVNTAYAIAKTEVVIFRKEEFEKVLFHELIHFYQLDILNYQTPIRNSILNIFNKNKKIIKFTMNPNEAYTDFLAIVLHLLYVNHVTKKSLKQLVKIELGYINHQAKKILKLANAKNLSNLVDNFNQSTSVFSYFILKSAMFNNINLIKTLNINDLSFDYTKIIESFLSKKWNKLLNNNNKLLKSNNQRMSYISKFL